jgi:Isopentenyldiphosphate isomerase
MEKDTVLVLDKEDRVIGSESKRASHEFNPEQPTGVLHRAFSVFIFDESTNELLVQQRAKEKITFPSVSSASAVATGYCYFCCSGGL